MSTTVPQVRASSREADGPAVKKQKIEVELLETQDTVKETIAAQAAEQEGVMDEVKAAETVVPEPAAKGAKQPKPKKKRKRKEPLPEPCSGADVLYREIRSLLGEDVVDKVTQEGNAFESPFHWHEEVVVKIQMMSSGGSGIASAPEDKGPWAIVVPVALVGETVIEILEPNTDLRDDSRIGCKYFGTCGGCQYQMLSPETQNDLKRNVIVKAYKMYSDLPESSIPTIESTVESPLLYNYRTKITPHFERAPKSAKQSDAVEGIQPDWLKIGFNVANKNHTLDIEECPIATSVCNEKYKQDRQTIIKDIFKYKKGVSLLYRDSLDTSFDVKEMMTPPIDKLSEAFTKHICVTDQNAPSREMVGDYIFEYTAGGFFQNNNSVLPLMVNFVRDLVQSGEGERPTHLVDTYCGAGLFAISLSSAFDKVAGIELSKSSIASAKCNAELNGLSTEKISFLSGEAQNIFATVKDFPRERTAIVIDPPRKGCDEQFLKQLLEFRSSIVVYVSCNVHSQARDIGYILHATENNPEGQRYRLERLRGFDLFPQTAHVESVALLRLY
ncbi:hypothetical protein D9619_003724 [Psilocybe cf. subviscida]|uniref:TRAM domain-containing protein n=1 Tax=Psilocybe cf. subviscida TaxID=2480587 RepID=A0A8H5EUM0_9AGAR|nr:hypothetical protein D9619_003724 [Psilocybe cf. subviscida]